MPYYSDMGIPSSSAYSSLFLPGPYSNHSSIIASNFSHLKTLPRQYRGGGYKPHLSTISELRRINTPSLLYHTSPKVSYSPIKKINTADIDVSVNRYKKYERYEKPKTGNVEKKAPEKTPSPKRSPRTSVEEKEQREAKPNTHIRRDRTTVRLHTVHKDTLQTEIGAIRSWRDNFKPEELDGRLDDSASAPKKMKKTPGELLKEKFLIRSRSKENMLKPESKRLSRKKSVRKSPSFHDICEAITSDSIAEELNPGQPEMVQRRQSRQISSEKMLKEIRRSSTTLSEDDIQILDAILAEQNDLEMEEAKKKEEDMFKSRESVRKKKIYKKKSSANLNLDEVNKSPSRISRSQSRENVDETNKTSLERRPTKKRLKKHSTDDDVEEVKNTNALGEQIYKNVVRDISQVEIEKTAFKPKPVITGSGEIEETKPSLKAVVDDIEVKEEPTPKKEKKFRFNVIVEVEDEVEGPKPTQKVPKISAEKFDLSNNRGKVQLPKGRSPVISSILKKRPLSYSGQTIEQKEKPLKKEKLVDNCDLINKTNSVTEVKDLPKAVEGGENKNIEADTRTEVTGNETVSLENKNQVDQFKTNSVTEVKDLPKAVEGGENKENIEADTRTEVTGNETVSLENKNQIDQFKTEIKTEPKPIPRLQKEISSSSSKGNSTAPVSPTVKEKNIFNKILVKKDIEPQPYSPPTSPLFFKSKENSPVPASSTIKEKHILNKILTKKDNESQPYSPPISPLFFNSKESSPAPASPFIKENNSLNKMLVKEENLQSNSNDVSINGTASSQEKIKSPPPSPLTRVQENSRKFASPPPSPLNKKQNIFSKGVTPPLSPVLKKENIFNKQLSKIEDKDDVTGTKENISKTDLTSNVNKLSNKRIGKKEETPPTSPTLKSQNFNSKISETVVANSSNRLEKEDIPPVCPTIKDQKLYNSKALESASEILSEVKEKSLLTQKDENDNNICLEGVTKNQLEKSESEKSVIEKKLVSKRSLVQKADKDDPDLEIFIAPEPEPKPEPEPEEKKDVFVPLQSNRLSQWMHPWKKPEQLDVCPVEIFARPKFIRGRHYPRPRGQPAPPPPKSEESSEEEEDEDETEDDTSSEEESTSEEESEEEVADNDKIGASTSSNDSGFGSGALGSNKDCDVNIHKKCEKLTANLCGVNQKLVVEAIESVRKGSLESRDSPTSNHANNPAFALDSGDIPEEYSQSSTFTGFQKSGRITPPATTIPRFRKYCVDDFNFLKVLGKGSFGKVLLAELKGTEYYYAIKCLKKDVVLEDDDVECTLIERKVLALGTKHPYLCHLLCTFQTESHLFFVMEYLNGGDLMFHIQASGRFPEHQARFYGAEIVSGLKFLHNKGIVYRDLKLDNVLLDFDGHVRIADFGMCKLQIFLDRMAETFCGTPDYMAPEIIKGQHYNQCVDWWSFGVLLYEMLLGQSPFSGCDEDELFWSICNEKPVLPRYLSAEATNILTLFLEKDASKRLGNRFSPHGEIQDQPFFRSIDWYALETRQLEAPFKPHLQHPLDTQYFDKHFTVEKAKLTPIETAILQSMDQTQFQGFSYTNPNATDK